ncbi:MAG TPA: hypothetical protein PKD09_17160 [Aggregatilinea sp.]|uniref:hypothetical protein n=1 Tax=Aggregatilinea sp. TaxID=2806333 RepID=UPI002C187F01|nr:hypothetical protein [Aggregatilinea sp.]HML23388.1 hypothetical protein [Aggregatilinea sp.]
MRKRLSWIAVPIIGAGLLAGCGSSNSGIQRVTPLPPVVAQSASATPTVEAVTEEAIAAGMPTVTASPSPTITATPDMAGDATGATPTPLSVELDEGEARRIAAATDTAYQPTAQAPVQFESFPVAMTFDEFYEKYDMRRGWILSDKLVSLDGREVVMEGYIAPPLKPKLDFFVLTQIPLAMCPFCSTDADWPDRIALVYLPEATLFNNRYPVRITGRMEVGSSVDASSGMVSLVRLYADEIEVLDG